MNTGRFELLTQRCAGPDGMVYVARDPRTGETVDLRLLTGCRRSPERKLELFRRLRLLALIHHPVLLATREMSLDGDPPFVVSSRAGEKTLLDNAARFRESLFDALAVAEQLAQGLAAAHVMGVVHGHLTPSRVWFDERPLIDLLPFDDGRYGDFANGESTAPFLDASGNATPSASGDVYSLGAILFWLMTGQPPAGPVTAAADAERKLDWTAGEQIRAVQQRLRPLLCNMLSADDIQRPGAREVAEQLADMIRVLADSVGRNTLVFTPPVGGAQNVAQNVASRQKAAPERIGRFQILGELGQGGIGMVYRARDPVDGQIVALKTLKTATSDQPQFRRRFLKEARLLEAVSSPFVTRLIEANEDDGTAFIALEFVDGESVAQYLSTHGRCDEKTALRIASNVARALDDAHARGIVHRDVKPENILLPRERGAAESDSVPPATIELDAAQPFTVELSTSKTVADERPVDTNAVCAKLTDFGLARQLEQSESLQVTQAGAILGTPLYMSPEQWTGGGDVDPRADVYSLGATLFHMLAGRPPFQGIGVRALMAQHMHEPLPSITKLNPAVSESVAALIEKSMAKDPGDRYPDAAEMLDDLEKALRGDAAVPVVHPLLPGLAAVDRFLTWEFQWELSCSPAELWPFVSNTDRVNRAIGLPAATFRTEKSAATGVRRFAEAHIGPVVMAWEEHPFEWIEGKRFGVLREFSRGPFVWFITTLELSERPAGGTLLTQSFKIEPRGMIGKLATKLQMGGQTRKSLERVYRRIDRIATAGIAKNTRPGVPQGASDAFEEDHRTSVSRRLRLEERLTRVIEAGVSDDVADQFLRFLLEAPDPEVARIRPIALARRLDLDERLVVDACLQGVKHGVLELLWDILCPVCRVAADIRQTLKALKDHEHCEVCDIDFAADFSETVELVFHVHPEIRKVKTGTYCIGGPAHFPHIVAQARLRTGEFVKWPLEMPAGWYTLRAPHARLAVDFHVVETAGMGRWDVEFGPQPPVPPEPLRADRQTIVLHNQTSHELLVRVERKLLRSDALTAAQASSLALFRDLFPNEVLAPGQLANVAHVTFLALSIGKLDSIYSERGDSGTFAVVHECLRLADDSVRQAGGAIVRLIGDGFLAAFSDVTGAVAVGLSLPAAIAGNETLRGLPVRIALHRGDAMLTTINDRLDYFGMTVNNVFDLLYSAEFGDMLITLSVSGDPAVAELLSRHDRRCEIIPQRWIGPAREPVQRLSVLDA